MRAAILILLLTMVSGSAVAKWVKVGGDETNTAYADPATKLRTGNVAKMWSLFDYKSSVKLDNGKRYLSTRAQFEYDCGEELMRGLAVSFHSQPMAGGQIVHNTLDPGNWGPVPPGTVNAALWKIACNRK